MRFSTTARSASARASCEAASASAAWSAALATSSAASAAIVSSACFCAAAIVCWMRSVSAATTALLRSASAFWRPSSAWERACTICWSILSPSCTASSRSRMMPAICCGAKMSRMRTELSEMPHGSQIERR